MNTVFQNEYSITVITEYEYTYCNRMIPYIMLIILCFLLQLSLFHLLPFVCEIHQNPGMLAAIDQREKNVRNLTCQMRNPFNYSKHINKTLYPNRRPIYTCSEVKRAPFIITTKRSMQSKHTNATKPAGLRFVSQLSCQV